MQINNLNQVGELSASDLVVLWAAANSQTRSATVAQFIELTTARVTDTLALPGGPESIGAIAVTATPTALRRAGVLQQTALADVVAAPTAANFNALLAKLRAAGILAV